MKIHFTKFAGIEVEILDYLSDDIVKFRFKNLDPDLKSKRWSDYLQLQERTNGRESKKLENEIQFKGYRSLGSVDELLNINFDHCFNAEYFFTNGQKIVSVLKKENDFQLGIHDYGSFQSFFPPLSNFYRFSLHTFYLKSYQTQERIHAMGTAFLSNVLIQRIPIQQEFFELRNIFSNIYHLKYKNETVRLEVGYPNKNLDVQFENLFQKLNLNEARCCFNCQNYEPMREGHAAGSKLNGHCRKIETQTNKRNEEIVSMFNWCHQFEKKI